MRPIQLSNNSVGASFLAPINRRAARAVRSQGSVIAVFSLCEEGLPLCWIGALAAFMAEFSREVSAAAALTASLAFISTRASKEEFQLFWRSFLVYKFYR